MNPEDADLVLALEHVREVDGVFALARPPASAAGWPRLFVALRDDTGHTLGAVTAIIVRALPHRDRSHIGIAATDRLRELWIPMGAPLSLSPSERAAAESRAEERERRYREEPTPLPRVRMRVEVEPAPISVPVRGPFRPGVVWTLTGNRVVVLEIARDPFRTTPRPLLIVTHDDAARRPRPAFGHLGAMS